MSWTEEMSKKWILLNFIQNRIDIFYKINVYRYFGSHSVKLLSALSNSTDLEFVLLVLHKNLELFFDGQIRWNKNPNRLQTNIVHFIIIEICYSIPVLVCFVSCIRLVFFFSFLEMTHFDRWNSFLTNLNEFVDGQSMFSSSIVRCLYSHWILEAMSATYDDMESPFKSPTLCRLN